MFISLLPLPIVALYFQQENASLTLLHCKKERKKERGYGGHQPHPRISVASPTNSFAAKLANLNCAAKNLVLQSFVMPLEL